MELHGYTEAVWHGGHIRERDMSKELDIVPPKRPVRSRTDIYKELNGVQDLSHANSPIPVLRCAKLTRIVNG